MGKKIYSVTYRNDEVCMAIREGIYKEIQSRLPHYKINPSAIYRCIVLILDNKKSLRKQVIDEIVKCLKAEQKKT